MKKIIILLLISAISVFSFAVDFTFKDYKPNVESNILITPKKVNSKFTLPEISSDNSSVDRKINRVLSSFKDKTAKIKNTVTYEIESDNAKVLSILFKIENENGVFYETYNFDSTTGDIINLGDLFLPGYEDSLNGALKDRIGQMGIPLNDKYKGVNSKGKYILKNDTIIFVFSNSEATDFGDKVLFVPFKIVELIGIIK